MQHLALARYGGAEKPRRVSFGFALVIKCPAYGSEAGGDAQRCLVAHVRPWAGCTLLWLPQRHELSSDSAAA